jgi:RNA polymerase sigma factor (sigma-70 family)
MSGGSSQFPVTPMSRLAALRGGEDRRYQDHLETLFKLYWKPVYAFIRRIGACGGSEAEDHTQEFFAAALESDLLEKFDPARGNFRTFLKTVLRNFMRDENRRAGAAKRGGGLRFLPLDEGKDRDLLPANLPPDEAFDRQWIQDVVDLGVQRLEGELVAEGRGVWIQALKLHDLQDSPPTYQDVARQLSISESDVRNYLHRARTRLRETLIRVLSEYIGADEEVLGEMRDFLKM